MHASGKISLRRRLLIAGLLLLAASHSAMAAGFFVLSARGNLNDNVYRLTATLRYQLSADVVRALKNGIPLVIELDIEVLEPQAWYLWSETVATLQQHYRVQYQALAQRYLVTNINSGVQDYFTSMDEAVASLGAVHDLPILDAGLLQPGVQYVARLRAGIAYDALPAPLRYYAFTLPEWRLSSEWYNFPL